MVWKGLALSAAMAALGCGSVALASDIPQAETANNYYGSSLVQPLLMDDATTTTAPAAAPASAPSGPTTLTPLMYAISPTAFGTWMTNHNLDITGFVEAGYFIDANNDDRGKDQPTLIEFPGAFSQNVLLDQLDLTISKTIDSTKTWDYGFLFENGYGIDDAQIHSDGILDNAPFPHPREQYDIIQANASIMAYGFTLTVGKFVALLGNEYISPIGNQFYTHSYSFWYGIPGTNTGILGSYTFPKLVNGNDLTVTGGITRGSNQSSRDNNGDPDGVFEAKSNINAAWSYVFNIEFGPEIAHDNSNWDTVGELILVWKASDELTLTGDFVYGDGPHQSAATPGESAQWYGPALYAAYKFDSYFTPQFRGEWYRDQGGTTVGTGVSANYYEFTAGVAIHPMPNDNYFQWLQVRPEIRDDLSDKKVFGSATSGSTGNRNQLTFAVDAIMQF